MAGVEASSSVSARPVVGAEIEVLVAEKAAPTFVADAVPGFYAGTMLAAGVSLALVA